MKPTYLDLTNPITAAVMPLKDAAIGRAEREARDLIAHIWAKIVEAGRDLNAAAPYPNSLRDGRNAYIAKKNRRALWSRLTKRDESVRATYRMNEPVIVVQNVEAEERFVSEMREQAGLQYDAFVAKLCAKIGDVVSAELSGSHVWGYSVLTVTKADGSVERWQTQQIVNQSVLGTLFNQWPTRQLKTRKAA